MEPLKKNQKRIISLKKAKRLIITLIVIFIFDFLLFPVPAIASEEIITADIIQENIQINLEDLEDEPEIVNHLPENNTWQAENTSHHVITAYNSEVGQTDSSPCITANGFNLCTHGIEDTVAANFLYFGTKIRIPDLFGDKVFIVRDRMNARYPDRLDIWMINKDEAKQFGVKVTKIEVLE